MAALFKVVGRALWFLLVIVASCALVFAILSLAPGDESAFGSSKSERDFTVWLLGAVRGDLGQSSSYRLGEDVSVLLRDAIGESVTVVGLALLFSIGAGMLLAWLWRARTFPRLARGSQALVYALSATPAFLLAYWSMLAINRSVAGAVMRGTLPRPEWFPLPNDAGRLRYWLAAAVLATGSGVLMDAARGFKAELDRITQSDFILFARASGAPLWVHVLPSLVAPFLTLSVNRFAGIFGGAVVIETIFSISGLGRLTWEASLRRDWRVLLGTTLVWAATYALARLGCETAGVLIDPRQRTAAVESP